MNNHLRKNFLSVLCVVVAGAPLPATGATYRAVYYLTSQTGQAVGIMEGSPGVFYSGANSVVIFSVTSQGVETTLATFQDPPYIVDSSSVVAAANGLFYSAVQEVKGTGSGNIF